jgi:hypothetical protein
MGRMDRSSKTTALPLGPETLPRARERRPGVPEPVISRVARTVELRDEDGHGRASFTGSLIVFLVLAGRAERACVPPPVLAERTADVVAFP